MARPDGSHGVLLVDDQPHVLTALRLMLKGEGIRCESADSPAAMLEAVGRSQYDLVLLDMNYSRDTTSGDEGLEALAALRKLAKPPPVIVMTAWGSIELAVEAMRRGARDFALKPWDNADLLDKVRKHAQRSGDHAATEAASPEGQEVRRAQEIQQRLLPQATSGITGLEYGGVCRPAGAVGGDFYDFVELGAGRVALTLADVSGKGLPAALLMANLQALIRSRIEEQGHDLSALLEGINRLFHAATRPEHYATMFLAVWDDSRAAFEWANCGHNAPFVLRAAGGVERLEASGPPIGLLPGATFTSGKTSLEPGDRLAAFSDGASEARLSGGEELGEARLLELLLKCSATGSAAWLGEAIAELEATVVEPPFDDVTLVCARRR